MRDRGRLCRGRLGRSEIGAWFHLRGSLSKMPTSRGCIYLKEVVARGQVRLKTLRSLGEMHRFVPLRSSLPIALDIEVHRFVPLRSERGSLSSALLICFSTYLSDMPLYGVLE